MSGNYHVQFSEDGETESQIQAMSSAARDEFAKRIYLQLQVNPGISDDGLPIVASPDKAGVAYVFGDFCLVEFTVDPTRFLVKILNVKEYLA